MFIHQFCPHSKERMLFEMLLVLERKLLAVPFITQIDSWSTDISGPIILDKLGMTLPIPKGREGLENSDQDFVLNTSTPSVELHNIEPNPDLHQWWTDLFKL
ncbi:hypothetical protein KIN20_024056 [Parelaphostrongylus tenuis]|uniref:Uncharacterized protein n=1 Tax=Parelaphostrongylus tenuis TaxID=148309 RepID=A0AAD5QVQ2_PARTN|nr:hypothetical protein KIN20_024056 [Parelaphostrongylus tenuis]